VERIGRTLAVAALLLAGCVSTIEHASWIRLKSRVFEVFW